MFMPNSHLAFTFSVSPKNTVQVVLSTDHFGFGTRMCMCMCII